MPKPIKEHVMNSFDLLNRMIDDCTNKENLSIRDVAEIQGYFMDCKVILKRALLMSNREIFSKVEWDELKNRTERFERKINNIVLRLNK